MRSIITVLLLLATTCALPLSAQEEPAEAIPAWPYRRIAWRAYLHQRLREITLSIALDNWTLEKVLGALSQQTRIRIRADKTLDPKAMRVNLTLRKARSLRRILDQLCQDKPYTWVLSQQAVVLTRMPSIYPPRDTRKVRRQIEDARFLPRIHANLRAVARRTVALRKALATDRLDLPALEMSGRDFLRGLSKRIGLPVSIQRGLSTTRSIRVAAGRRVLLSAFLAQALGQLQLGWIAYRGRIWVGDSGFIALQQRMQQQSQALREATEKARAKVLDRPITLELKDLRLHALSKRLERALGLPVLIGPKAWRRGERLTFSLTQQPLHTLRKKLPEGVQLVVLEEAVYLLSDR